VEQKSPLLSVVIPVWNVERYLAELFMSLDALAQWDVEVLFVEDCSTDGSLSRLEEYAQASPLNVRIIRHEKNGGLSAARNTGLAQATGDYVWFVDSDDVINSPELAGLFDVLNTHQPDVLAFDFLYLSEGFFVDMTSGQPVLRPAAVTSKPEPRTTTPGQVLTGSHKLMAQALHDLRLHAWSYCYKRGLLGVDPFPAGRVYEDIATVPMILHAAKTVYYHATPLIFYRVRPDSITKKVNAKRDLDLAHAMARDWAILTKNREQFSDADVVAYLATWLKTLQWSINNLHTSGLLAQPEIFDEYSRSWQSYRRAAGGNHFAAIRALPRPTVASRIGAVTMTISPKLMRFTLGKYRPSATEI
jgi:glycosyltransferase involved in cell wall biosynthesis